MDSRVRASSEQHSTMLEYMETHGDLARPLDGSQGRVRSDRLWSDLTNMLNAVGGGVNKTTDKWKKVWADWKSKTKKKALTIRHHARGTGGGPESGQTLSAAEERLLSIMGMLADIWLMPSTSAAPTPPAPPPPIPPPPPRSLVLAGPSSQGREPVVPSPQAPPTQSAPSQPAPETPTSVSRRRSPAPQASATPPSTRRRLRLRSPASPRSDASPGSARLRARRRRAMTPFERAASDFTAVESRRLELEETRIRLQHERDMRALEVEHERNQVFRSVVDIAPAWLDYYRSRDNTEPLK